MFVLLHTESSTGWGGQEIRILLESIGLKKRGARVIILCQPGSALAHKAPEHGIEVRTCRMRKSYDVAAVSSILKVIKADNVDVISTHSGKDSLLAGVAGRLSRRKPLIVRTRHLALPITSRISYSLLPHHVVTTSEYVRRYLISKNISADRMVSVPTGVDTSRYSPDNAKSTLREELNLPPGAALVGIVAILRHKKGHHVLLDAVPEILKAAPKTVFVFAGDGPQHEKLTQRIKELGLTDKVLMLGLRHDMPDVMKSLDILVLPTLQESLPQVVMQAMAMGKPVIGSNVGGVGEVIKDGLNGYLVEPNDPQGLARAVIKVLTDPKKAADMGREGKLMIERELTLEKMCDKMYDLYSSLIKERR